MTQGLEARERMLATGNRWGKSTVSAVRALHHATFRLRERRFAGYPDYVVCCVSITQDQARIVWREALRLAKESRYLRGMIRRVKRTPFPLIEFTNGAQIWARSTERPDFLWGHRFDFVVFDEPAFERHPEETLSLLRTRVVDRNGCIDFVGTPNFRNWYYRQFMKGVRCAACLAGEHTDCELAGSCDSPRYYSQGGSTAENPYVSERALRRLAAHMTERQRLTHLEGQFLDNEGAVFPQEELAAAVDPSLRLEGPREGVSYVSGWDIAVKRDWTVGVTLALEGGTLRLVDFVRMGRCPWAAVYGKIREVHARYRSLTVIDSTGVGDPVVEELSDIGAVGFSFAAGGGKSKTQLLLNLASNLGRLRMPLIPELVEELSFYEWDDRGLRTDCVMALALAVWGATRLPGPAALELWEV